MDPVCGACTLPRDIWDAEHHEYVHVEEDSFPNISSVEERDAISVKITECEHDEKIAAWVAADAAVWQGKTNFMKNGGFERGAKVDHGESNADIMASLHELTGDATMCAAQ